MPPEVLICWLLPALKMAGRSECGCAASSKMENNTDLVRLERRVDAALSEARERLLRMQVLRGVLDRERLLLRIVVQEKELDSLKVEQRRLQDQVAERNRSPPQRDEKATMAPEVSWMQLENKLQSFVDSPPRQPPPSIGGTAARVGGDTQADKMETSTATVSTERSSVVMACGGDMSFSDPIVTVSTQHRGRGRGRGGRRGGRGRGRRRGKGRQNISPPQQSTKYVLGDGELVNLSMLGVLGLLDSDTAGPSGDRTRDEVSQAEESPLPPVPGGLSPSGCVDGPAVDGATSSTPDTLNERVGQGIGAEEGGGREKSGQVTSATGVVCDSEGPARCGNSDRVKGEGDHGKVEGDSSKNESDGCKEEGDGSKAEGDDSKEGDDSSKNEGDSSKEEGDGSKEEGDGSKEEGDGSKGEGDDGNDGGENSQVVCDAMDGSDSKNGVGGIDRAAESGRRGDSTVVLADSVGVAQELPVGEQLEEMVVTLSATASPPLGEVDPLAMELSEFVPADGVSSGVRHEPGVSKPGKRRGRPPKDTSKAKKVEGRSKNMENGTTARGGRVHPNGKGVPLNTGEEWDVEPAASQAGKRRKTISKLQTSFLPNVPPAAEPIGKAPFTWKGFRAPVIKCNPPKLLKITKEPL